MSDMYPELDDRLMRFIRAQHMFFVATACAEGYINLSPKGMDSLRIVERKRVLWLNLTGSGNETAGHVLDNGRMTLMFCSFTRQPLILRLYGQARTVHPRDEDWEMLYAEFDEWTGARQVFDMQIELVQTSCGYAVPHYSFESERETLTAWAEKRGRDGIEKYWQDRNARTLNGFPTDI
ncbi:MAG: pyridoxamine 5'-phosphate oxidase family protein [Pseudomonadota bacterium]